MILHKIAKFATAATIMAAVASCNTDVNDAGQFRTINSDGWIYGDTLTFDNLNTDSIANGHLIIAVRHTDAYQYGNIWLELTTPTSGDSLRVDTINIQLADIYGKWYGRGSGVSFIATDTLIGSYRIERDRPAMIRHIMRVDTLMEIEQIGLIFNDKTKN